MPVSINSKNGKYRVSTPNAKGTTREKAMAQRNLLNAVEHNPDFKPNKKKNLAMRARAAGK